MCKSTVSYEVQESAKGVSILEISERVQGAAQLRSFIISRNRFATFCFLLVMLIPVLEWPSGPVELHLHAH